MDLVPILVTVGTALSVIGTVMFRKKGARTNTTLNGESEVPLIERGIDAITQTDVRLKKEKLKLSKQGYQDAIDLADEYVNKVRPHADEQEKAKLKEERVHFYEEKLMSPITRKKAKPVRKGKRI
jgi:hypothetical protein